MSSPEMKEAYTLAQRIWYQIRRHLIFLVILIPCMIYLAYLPASDTSGSMLTLLIVRAAKSASSVSLSILFSKFAFPKVDLQRELIEENNVAIAILFLAIVVGANL